MRSWQPRAGAILKRYSPCSTPMSCSARTVRPSLAGATSARGAAAVAENFAGRARAARPALVGGSVGLVWAPGGDPQVAFGFTITEGKVVAIELIADPERIRELEVEILKE